MKLVKPQTKIMSLVEQAFRLTIGYVVSVLSILFMFPVFNVQVDFDVSLKISACFTVISFCTGFMVRRLFNYLHFKDFKKRS